MFKAKVLVVGPVKSGKTTLANFLGDATEAVGGEYSPTQGVRILEFESGTVDVSGRAVTCEVELWDCSGDMKFEACWPALQRDVSGVMLVFDAEQASHARELEAWHTAFVLQPRLQESQCLLVAHRKPGSDASRPLPGLGVALSKLPLVISDLEEVPESLSEEFRAFLGRLVSSMSDSRDREELSIVGS
ncbi:unnamed protein product [Lampetra fluviatilis]